MKQLIKIFLGFSLITSTALFANSQNHMGDHMHNGVMTNHSNPNGMTNEQMKELQEQQNNHMGDHMHNGVMTNHSNPNGMTNEQMKEQEHGHSNGNDQHGH